MSAKELTALLIDEDRLRSERSDRKLWKSRVAGLDDGMQGFAGGSEIPPRRRRDRPSRPDEDDTEYRLAIEASKHEAEEDRKRRERNSRDEDVDDELAKAIRLSKEEEELRRRELEESNAASLFDDAPAQPAAQPQPTGYNQGYQQQGAVDWFGNPVDPQQAMTTGFLNNQYSQPTGFAQQQTGFPNNFSNGLQPQATAFDQQFPQQQQQQQANFMQPQTTMQPQQTAFTNPYANDMFGQQPQQQQQQQPQPPQQPQQQQDNFLSPGSHNPWATNTQPAADGLKPAPTGSNNPFASSFTRAQAQMPTNPSGPPSLNTLAEHKTAAQFSQPNPIANFQAPQPSISTPPTAQNQQNPQHARLNALLSTGDGQDTFGNVGDLRIPSQHTAPGVFVNSAGQGLERLPHSQTGNNPFFNQQFTGAPQQHPAFTGQPNKSPFAPQQGYGTNQQGGNLIDL